MRLAIVLVFALNIFGVQSGCYHYYRTDWGGGWRYSLNDRNYQCVQQEKCFDNQHTLTREQRWATQNGRCNRFGSLVVGYICCLHKSPPPRRSPNFHTRTPTRNPSSRPMTISSHKPNRRQQSQPQSPTSPPISPSQNNNCKCILKNKCHDKQISSIQLTQENCPNTHELCCRNFLQPLSSSTINQSPEPKPPSPSPTSPQVPTRAPSFRPRTQGPSQISPQIPISNTAPQPQPTRPSQTFPLNTDCTCTPFFRCNDDETSSNLTGVVDDRTFTQQRCPSPNDICCRNLIQSSSTPSINPLPQSQPQGLPAISSSTNANCNCIPTSECHDKHISSNPTGLLDDRNNNRPLRQESCPNSNHVCCHNLVQPLSTSTRNPSLQPQPQSPAQISPQRPTVGPSSRPQSPSPPQISQSSNSNCLCTPFYKCYDEETSSNLAGVVDDRSFIPINEETCSDPNEICCHNLVKPMEKPDCSGSCVFIIECPYLSNKLNEAKGGNLEAIQELRRSVCSNTNGNLRVCCPSSGGAHPFGVIFRNN